MALLPALLLFGVSMSPNPAPNTPIPGLPSLFPMPQDLQMLGGAPFFLDKNTRIYDSTSSHASAFLKTMAKNAGGFDLRETTDRSAVGKPGTIAFVPAMPEDGVRSEGYKLKIQNGSATVKFADEAGAFYAVQTLRQLLPNSVEGAKGEGRGAKLTLPNLTITDYPRFGWRGMHLDVSRHFFPPAFIKRYIDFLALHKMNRFHWHLVDDGGWRMEVKKYPKLTEVGAWRTDTGEVWPGGAWNMGGLEFPGKDSGKKLYGGFYTQDEIREIVNYASDRHVEVIPEIEMPGHNLPAMIAYPDLGCNLQGADTGMPKTNVFCAGKDSTLQFLEDVLKETMDLFPSKWIHVGADEVWKGFWQKCPDCQARIENTGLTGDRATANGYRADHSAEENLQSWFVRYFENFLWRSGRTLIGWDEILEGGLAPGATVMSWRGIDGGIAAAKSGHEAVMSPTSHCYFDYGYEGTSTKHVYGWEPVPEALNADESKFILGGQANVWTEWIASEARVEYMIFPRMLATAEVLWLDPKKKDWESFSKRLGPYFGRLDALQCTYQMPAPEVQYGAVIFSDTAEVPAKEVPGIPFSLRYTTDGTNPDGKSAEYKGPIQIRSDAVVSFAYVNTQGKPGDVARVSCKKFVPSSDKSGLAQGLSVVGVKGDFSKVPDFAQQAIASSGFASVISNAALGFDHEYALRFTGFFEATADGLYTFALSSDDGSTFKLAGAMVVDNDGLHGMGEKSASIQLKKGLYPIEVGYFEQRGGKGLKLIVEGPGLVKREVPENLLWRKG